MTEKKKYTLEDENKLLKQALRESLQAEGDGCLIETLDELFDLKYDEWEASGHYQDWDKNIRNMWKKMTRRFYIDNKENIIENNGYAELNKYTFKDKNDFTCNNGINNKNKIIFKWRKYKFNVNEVKINILLN